ncbi:MAG: hypothetical protein AB7P03_02705 [Kofleriaceae bacterium]
MEYEDEEPSDVIEPFNWCDRRCARCPLADECVIAIDETEQRARHIAAGIDPDAAFVVEEDMIDKLDHGLELAIEAARQDGIDPAEALAQPPPAPPEVAMRRRELVMKLVEAIHHGCAAMASDAARTAIESSVILGMKVYALHDAQPPDVDSDFYLAANLMVVMRVEAELRSALNAIEVPERQRDEIERLRNALCLVLAPLWAAVPSDVIEEIEAMSAAKRAPSPFCVRSAST